MLNRKYFSCLQAVEILIKNSLSEGSFYTLGGDTVLWIMSYHTFCYQLSVTGEQMSTLVTAKSPTLILSCHLNLDT